MHRMERHKCNSLPYRKEREAEGENFQTEDCSQLFVLRKVVLINSNVPRGFEMKYTQSKGDKGDFFQKWMEQKQPSGYFSCFCLRSTGSLKILIWRSNSAETEPKMNILTS